MESEQKEKEWLQAILKLQVLNAKLDELIKRKHEKELQTASFA